MIKRIYANVFLLVTGIGHADIVIKSPEGGGGLFLRRKKVNIMIITHGGILPFLVITIQQILAAVIDIT